MPLDELGNNLLLRVLSRMLGLHIGQFSSSVLIDLRGAVVHRRQFFDLLERCVLFLVGMTREGIFFVN